MIIHILRKSFIIIFLLPLFSFSASAQTWSFVQHAGSSTNDYATHVAIDAEGNSYIFGEYTGTATFDTIIVQSQGKWNAILAKYNPSGKIIWAKTVAFTKDPLSDLYANALHIDKSGEIYVGGKFVVDVTISGTTFSCNGASDMYLAKLSGDGSLLWAKQIGEVGQGSYGQDEIKSVTTDAMGNCFITGTYNKDVKFDSIALSSPNTMEVFIAKYDSSGKALWALSGGEYGVNHTGTAIEVDGLGNNYVTGIFYEKLALGKDTLDAVDAEQKIFLAKIDPDGAVIWAEKIGSGGYYGGTRDMKIDSAGNCYLTGFFRAGMHIGSEDISYSNGLYYAVLILKYDKDGNFLWVRKTDGSDQNATASAIAIDAHDNLFITGTSSSSVSFGSTLLSNTQAAGFGFATELNSDGNFLWTKPLDGYGHIGGTGIAVTSSGDCFITGTFDSVLSLGSNSIASYGSSDAFLAKLNITSNGVEDNQAPSASLSLYPNPARDILQISGKFTRNDIQIISASGILLDNLHSDQPLDIHGLSSATYFLRIDGKMYKFIKE